MPTVVPGKHLSLKNILVPTDFSAASLVAVPFAAALARSYGSTLLLAHAVAPVPHLEVVTARVPAGEDYSWKEAREKTTAFAAALGDLPWKALLDQGDVKDVIPALIREQEVDLVVLGTHGRRGVSKVVLGSEAEKIYRSATCPVLTVGPNAHAMKDWKLRRILCAVDRAGHPETVIKAALALAEDHQAALIVLQAIPLVPWQYQDAIAEQARQAIQKYIPEEHEGCELENVIRWEHPVESILHTAAEREADVIVMGVRKPRASGFSTHLPWPIASEVVSRAACPVLTVRV